MHRRSAWSEFGPTLRRSAKPDPDVRRLLAQLSLVRLADMTKVSVQTVRRQWQLCVMAFATRDATVSVTKEWIDLGTHQIGLHIHRSASCSKASPILVWYHGGGFVFGDLYTAGATCRALARRTGAIVVAVDYRLAPEHSLADARSDCFAALRWVACKAADLGGDSNRIAVGGDSAGGTLASLVAQEAVRSGEVTPRLQLLVYPACDLSRDHTHSPDAVAPLTGAHVAWLRRRIGAVSDLDDATLSPLRQPVSGNTPKTVMLTAGFDPLRDEAAEFARKLTATGVPVRLLHYPGQFHGFLSFDRVLAGGKDALDRVASVVKVALATGVLQEGIEEVLVPKARAVRTAMSTLGPAQRLREAKVVWLMMSDFLLRRPKSAGQRSRSPAVQVPTNIPRTPK